MFDEQALPGRLDVPPLWCPISVQEPLPHPEVEERSLEWLERYGFLEDPGQRNRLVASKATEWGVRVAPRAPVEGLQLLSDTFYYASSSMTTCWTTTR